MLSSWTRWVALAGALLSAFALDAQTWSTVRYLDDATAFASPERGLCLWTRSEPGDRYPFSADWWLRPLREDEQQTLIARTYYLSDALDGPIPATTLDSIQADLDAVRAAGLKLVLRFAYTYAYGTVDSAGNPIAPYRDGPADPELIFGHVRQLRDELADDWDVVFTLHNGFWGTWGENFYSDAFGSLAWMGPGVTDAQWALRARLTDTLLAMLPPDRLLSLRYPQLKERYFGLDLPADSLTAATAHDGSPQARTGYHNDCFLVDFDDYTYSDTAAQKPFVAAESRYTVMGGETCGDSPYAGCDDAVAGLGRFHWTYLNTDYHPDVLARWRREGCYGEIERRLGYRLHLDSMRMLDADTPVVELHLRNSGFAAPVNPRPVELRAYAFHPAGWDSIVTARLDVDVRDWTPGTHVVRRAVPEFARPALDGAFDLTLALPDPSPRLRDRPEYALRLASRDELLGQPLFSAETGEHFLVEVGMAGTEADASRRLPMLRLAPNPASGSCVVQLPGGDQRGGRLVVADALGRSVNRARTPPGAKTHELDLRGLAPGTYIVRWQDDSGSSASARLVVVHP